MSIPYRGHHRTRAQSGRVCTKRCYPTEHDAHAQLEHIRTVARATRDQHIRQERKVQWCWAHGAYHLSKRRSKKV